MSFADRFRKKLTTGQVIPFHEKQPPPPPKSEWDFSAEDLDRELAEEETIELSMAETSEGEAPAIRANKLQTVPRETLIELLNLAVGVPFTFATKRGKGDDFIQAMRQTLSRVRDRARARGKKLNEFKLVKVAVVQHTSHDEVTIKRLIGRIKEESVFDKLEQILEKKL